MHCLACDRLLTDKEASRKFINHEDIKNPEEKYIGLCSRCSIDDDELNHELLEEEVDNVLYFPTP